MLIIIRSGRDYVIRVYDYQSPMGVYMCFFLGQELDCAYTICWCGQN